MEQCVALYDYDGRYDENGLSFKTGDVITVVAKGQDSGWWTGCLNQTTGVFPNVLVSGSLSRLSRASSHQLENVAVALYDYSNAAEATEMNFRKHDVIRVSKECQGSPGWWWAANLTQNLPDELKMVPSNFFTCDVVKSLFTFHAREARELSLSKGDHIVIKRRWNDGWWEGYLRGQRGIFPANYTTSNACTLPRPLFCGMCKAVFKVGATECHACAVNDEITTTMLATLEEWAAQGANLAAPPDFFSYIPLLPEGGSGSLLTKEDMETTASHSAPSEKTFLAGSKKVEGSVGGGSGGAAQSVHSGVGGGGGVGDVGGVGVGVPGDSGIASAGAAGPIRKGPTRSRPKMAA